MDAAAARREARRKRILENSHNRLELIAGKKKSEDCVQDTSSKNSYSEQIFESPAVSRSTSSVHLPPVNNGGLCPDPELPDLRTILSENRNSSPAVDTEIVNDSPGFCFPPPEAKKSKSRLERIVANKYDVVLLAMLIQLLYNSYIYENTYFFLPLLIYSVTKLVWLPAPNEFNMANTILLMHGISANKVQKIMTFFHWVTDISNDTCVYLFTTICIQSLLIAMDSYLVITWSDLIFV